MGRVNAWVMGIVLFCMAAAPAEGVDRLGFVAEGKGYRFDTGVLRGVLRGDGRAMGLGAVVEVASGQAVSASVGLFSHYRLLDAETRYGPAAWDWVRSKAELLADGSVRASWPADGEHPFAMSATYRWSKPNVLDVTTQVTAGRDLRKFEVFLASYFNGFPEAFAYVKNGEGKGMFEAAKQASGDWQMFPRDAAAVGIIQDGRWKRPPNPVEWTIRGRLAGAMGMRRDGKTGLTAMVMTPLEDCFAVAMPYGEEGHRSLYLSLLGRDLKAGETAVARARLVIGRDITDQQAIAMYEAYLRE